MLGCQKEECKNLVSNEGKCFWHNMGKTPFRIYFIVDYGVDLSESVLAKLREDYEVVDGLTLEWHVERRDLSKAPWENYLGFQGALGVSVKYIAKQAKELSILHGEKYHSVCLVINEKNWQDGEQRIGGWNLGQFFSGLFYG